MKLISTIITIALLISAPVNAKNQIPLFADMNFQKGFHLSYPTTDMGRQVEAVLDYDNPDNKPAWRLCQWATKYSFATAKCTHHPNGDLTYENKGKKVTLTKDNNLTLQINGKEEYGPTPRKFGQPWPHLLIEQDAINIFPLSDLSAINFSVSARLTHFQNHMKPSEYDPSLHAAQFQMFFIVKNIHPGSKDHNNFFWFGVPFFDNRHDIPPEYMAKDIGKNDATGKFIYTIAGKETNKTPMKNQTWIKMQKDLLPYIKSGLTEAVKRNYLTDPIPNHYAAVNMNLGWEIPGTFNAAAQIKDLKINAMPAK